MREFLNVSVLAVLQGVAEFLPVSSSGHLVIGQHFLGVAEAGMRLDVFLHMGTLLAVFAYYWRRCLSLATDWRYAGKILLSALPAVAVYFTFKRQIDPLFENAKMVGALLMFTGAVLVGTRYLPRGSRDVSWLRALWMGVLQAVALLPGVSRSGMTLAAARSGRVSPEAAAEFSFLMSAPLILGGVLLEVKDVLAGDEAAVADGLGWGMLAWGTVLAAVVGYFSLVLLVKALKGKWFWCFGPYCILAGLLTLCFT